MCSSSKLCSIGFQFKSLPRHWLSRINWPCQYICDVTTVFFRHVIILLSVYDSVKDKRSATICMEMQMWIHAFLTLEVSYYVQRKSPPLPVGDPSLLRPPSPISGEARDQFLQENNTYKNTHNSEVTRPSSMLQREIILVSWAGAIFCCCPSHDEDETLHFRARQYTEQTAFEM